MARFYKHEIGKSNLEADNTVVLIKDCLELISDSNFKEDLHRLFGVEKVKDDKLMILGLSLVMKSIISKDREFQKIDIQSHPSNIEMEGYDPDNPSSLKLRFSNLPDDFEEESIEVYTVYNAGHEYLDGTYQLDRFATFCIKNGFESLIQSNISFLNEQFADKEQGLKNYRLLKNREGNYFLRAITSASLYKDYNIRFSLFVAIMTLNRLVKRKSLSFNLVYCEYSESHIKLHLETGKTSSLTGLGTLKFLLEMTNDEIKRESFKFSGLFSVFFSSKGKEYEIGMQPDPSKRLIKTSLISIRHSLRTESVYQELNKLESYIENAESEMREQIQGISKAKNPDHIRFKLKEILDRSRDEGIKLNKDRISKILNSKITKMSELLEMMGKVNELVPSEFETKQYLRYLYYDLLSERK